MPGHWLPLAVQVLWRNASYRNLLKSILHCSGFPGRY